MSRSSAAASKITVMAPPPVRGRVPMHVLLGLREQACASAGSLAACASPVARTSTTRNAACA